MLRLRATVEFMCLEAPKNAAVMPTFQSHFDMHLSTDVELVALGYSSFLYSIMSTKIYRIGFYMGRFGSKTPKRTRLWSNSPGIIAFTDHRPLSKRERKLMSRANLVHKYLDKEGKRRYQGKAKALKASGYLCSF